MAAPTLNHDRARTLLEAGCDDVRDAGPGDAVGGVVPSFVARPRSTEEVAAVLAAAAGGALAVVPRGAGTKLGWGLPPERADLVLDLGAMSGVLEHAAGD